MMDNEKHVIQIPPTSGHPCVRLMFCFCNRRRYGIGGGGMSVFEVMMSFCES